MRGMYLFAYGTLQPTANLNFFESNKLAEFLTPVFKGTVRGELVHLKNTKQQIEYPGLVNTDTAKSVVFGTLFAVKEPTKAFEVMDEHEGFDPQCTGSESNKMNFYQRIELDVETESGERVKAETYILNRKSDYYKADFIKEVGLVESGDWLKYSDGKIKQFICISIRVL